MQDKFESVLLVCVLDDGSVAITVITVFVSLGKLMSSLLNGIHDRSNVVQKAYAFALGHLVRVSSNCDK